MAEQIPSRELLIVEDDADTRAALAEILTYHGYKVGCASNGREALALLLRSPLPRLILLDLRMPVMDGWQFRWMQKNTPRLKAIPVVVVSALEDTAQIEADAIIRKPIDIDALLRVVRLFFE